MGVMTSMALGAVALGGSIMSAAGQVQQGKAASRAMEYNAQVTELQMQNVEKATDLEVWKQGREAKKLAGAQRAGYAASGVAPTGTPLLVELESAANAEMDMMITKWNGEVSKSKLKSEAAYQRMQGENYKSAGLTSGTATLLQGFTNFGTSTFGGTAPSKPPTTTTGTK